VTTDWKQEFDSR